MQREPELLGDQALLDEQAQEPRANDLQEVDRLQAALKKRAEGPVEETPTEADPAETLAAVLVGHDESGEQVQRIYRLAAANQVTVAQADFQLDGDVSGIERLQISIPTKASYPQLRRFLEACLRELPNASLDTWPTQLYSSINAFLLCALLWFYYPFRKADGELMAVLLILYSIARFLEEFIRIDEVGMFGTPFSIGQFVSIACLIAGAALFAWLRSPARGHLAVASS